MIKKVVWALASGILAGGVSYSYGETFETQLMEDYSNVVPTAAIFISCLIATILATLGHWLLTKIIPFFGEFIFALLFAALSTASLVGVLGYTFTDDSNELHQFIFYGYAMPMHFFPFLAWYVFKPLFDKKYTSTYNEHSSNQNDQSSAGLNILSFLIPLVGLIIYLTERDRSPRKANSAGKAALWGVGVSVILSIISFFVAFALISNVG